MSTLESPVVRHRDWRFLLHDFRGAYPKMRPLPRRLLQLGLSPAASIAWWVARARPELLEQDSLRVLVPGAGSIETTDNGRWFAFLPWLLGRPTLQTEVVLVGDDLADTKARRKLADSDKPPNTLSGDKSPTNSYVAHLPKCVMFNGTLGQWRATAGQAAPADVCILFSPGFVSHYKTWLTESDLLPLLREGRELGVFFYSRLDGLEDAEILRLLGIEVAATELKRNPWQFPNEERELLGCFAQFAQTLKATSVPARLDIHNAAVQDFLDLEAYSMRGAEFLAGDMGLERLGAVTTVLNEADGGEMPVIELPRGHGVSPLTGTVGNFDGEEFTPCDPPVLVPLRELAARPADEPLIERIFWALKLHRDVIAPQLEGREDSEEDSFFQELFPVDVITETVAPMHPNWMALLTHLGWTPEDYEDDTVRLEPAFWVSSQHYGMSFPVICESYAYFPDALNAPVARAAMERISDEYPDGALLLFKSLPYRDVQGHKYHFGGMLFWKRKWSAFALNPQMHSIDAILEQLASGFTFETVNPKYADDDCNLATPFNQMCEGLEPSKKTQMVPAQQGSWVTLVPAECASLR